MKHILPLIFAIMALPIAAQTTAPEAVTPKDVLRNWDTEHMIDSLDQEKLPHTVSGGLIINANISNFILNGGDGDVSSSYMKIGGDLGGFLDFRLTKHFFIQPQLIFTAEQNRNRFSETEGKNLLWSFGVDIPVFFMGRWGNAQDGYATIGAGPFTHFTFASNVATYSNIAPDPAANTIMRQTVSDDDPMASAYRLHDNHSGIALIASYEFTFGMQLFASYHVSLSDIISFRSNNQENQLSIYPQKVSLGLGYRWK